MVQETVGGPSQALPLSTYFNEQKVAYAVHKSALTPWKETILTSTSGVPAR